MPHPEAAYLDFCPEQSRAIALASQTIADLGGPEAKGAAVEARAFADQLDKGLDEKQRSLLLRFNEGNVSTLMFRQMRCADEPIPEHLPDIHDLAQSLAAYTSLHEINCCWNSPVIAVSLLISTMKANRSAWLVTSREGAVPHAPTKPPAWQWKPAHMQACTWDRTLKPRTTAQRSPETVTPRPPPRSSSLPAGIPPMSLRMSSRSGK